MTLTFLPDTTETRQGMIDTCLWMNRQSINQGTSGNISIRTEKGVLITPSGIPYEGLTPADLVTIPAVGEPSTSGDYTPSSEWRFHQGLLAARPDMSVVLHAHPPYCSALSVQRRSIPACHYMIAAFGGADVPLADYALFGSVQLADNVSKVMTNRHGCLMANHGATVVGETLAKARWRLEELETLARTYLLGHVGGTPHILSDNEIEEAVREFASYGPR